MRQKSIEVPGLAHASAPVPMASRVGPIFATSGIFGKNPDTGQMPPDAVGQAIQCFDNLKRLLAAAGLDMGDVVKITIFLKDIRHAPAEISVREALFEPGRYPICTLVQVANLGLPDLLMEVDAVAVLS